MANPATGAGLYAVELPAEGGRTYWANLVAAYEALPERLKQAIAGRNALFRYQKRLDMYKGADQKLPQEGRKRTPDVVHPLVHVHPINGKKALYLDPTTSVGIVGMPDAEANALWTSWSRMPPSRSSSTPTTGRSVTCCCGATVS
jgi:alpha-ketoglutarate-dependent taurine dioxygenase